MKSISREKFNTDIKAAVLSVMSLIGFLVFWQIAAHYVASPFFASVGAV